jgi:hypothetical protein
MKVSGTSDMFFPNGADIPMTNDEKLFVLVQQHGEILSQGNLIDDLNPISGNGSGADTRLNHLASP